MYNIYYVCVYVHFTIYHLLIVRPIATVVSLCHTACVYGDPYIITLDGHKYTFNGNGEFILIKTPDDSFSLQG